MYAVIETGGKQYRVELGTELAVELLPAAPGETIELGRVLLLADGDEAQIGRPTVDGASVSADVVRQDRGDKIVVFKYQPKARRRVKHGHRQDLTIVRISDIQFNGRSAAKEAAAEARDQDASRKAAEEEAARKAEADRQLAAKLEREQKATEKAAADEQKADDKRADDKKAAAKPTRARKSTPAKATKATATAKADDAAEAADKPAKTETKPASRRKPATKKEE
jgi:large subunit ribosomal protein L21